MIRKNGNGENMRYINANELATIIGCSKRTAYNVIKQCNDELKAKGFITFRGKVNEDYLLKRLYTQQEELQK